MTKSIISQPTHSNHLPLYLFTASDAKLSVSGIVYPVWTLGAPTTVITRGPDIVLRPTVAVPIDHTFTKASSEGLQGVRGLWTWCYSSWGKNIASSPICEVGLFGHSPNRQTYGAGFCKIKTYLSAIFVKWTILALFVKALFSFIPEYCGNC